MDQASTALNSGPHHIFGKRLTLEYKKNSRAADYPHINESPSGAHIGQDPSQGTKSTLRSTPITHGEKCRPKHVEGKDLNPSSKKTLNTSCRFAQGQPCFPLVTNLSAIQVKGFRQHPEVPDIDHAVECQALQMQHAHRAADSASARFAAAEHPQPASLNESRMQEFYRHLRERSSHCSTHTTPANLNNEVSESRHYRFNRQKQPAFRIHHSSRLHFSSQSTSRLHPPRTTTN